MKRKISSSQLEIDEKMSIALEFLTKKIVHLVLKSARKTRWPCMGRAINTPVSIVCESDIYLKGLDDARDSQVRELD